MICMKKIIKYSLTSLLLTTSICSAKILPNYGTDPYYLYDEHHLESCKKGTYTITMRVQNISQRAKFIFGHDFQSRANLDFQVYELQPGESELIEAEECLNIHKHFGIDVRALDETFRPREQETGFSVNELGTLTITRNFWKGLNSDIGAMSAWDKSGIITTKLTLESGEQVQVLLHKEVYKSEDGHTTVSAVLVMQDLLL